MNSFWLESNIEVGEKNKQISSKEKTDVLVIGAGLTGLSTAYYLLRKGYHVIIVDKEKIGQKVSGHTTAKITAQHGLIYDYLIHSFDEEFARGYLQANQEAIHHMKQMIEEEKIDCDFEEMPNYVYTTIEEDVQKIKDEVEAINYLTKEKTASFVTDLELPFPVLGAIKLENQAQFHPVKYMQGLVKAIQKYGGKIVENSLVTDVKKEGDGFISKVGENEIDSQYVVLASHYPFINFPGFYFSKMYQVTSYALGIETSASLPTGMYLNTGDKVLSFRTFLESGKRKLIVSGGNHKTGFSPESEDFFGYAFLEKQVQEYFPDAKIQYRWNTRDCITLDKVPYIGEFSTFMSNMFVATGFNKWGMTTSNVAANIICDKICGKDNPYERVFDSTRFGPVKNFGEVKNMVKQVAQSFVTSRLKIPEEDTFAIKNDNGGIIKIDGNSVGIYKDVEGKIYAVNPTCTHLGCLLTWNNVDKTWDCPCHGSRFDYQGKNLYDPAFEDLERYEIGS